jgi:hypothetical protein
LNPRIGAFFEPNVARPVHHSAAHQFSPFVIDGAWPSCLSLRGMAAAQ